MKIELTNDQLKSILSDYFHTPIEAVVIVNGDLIADTIMSAIGHYDPINQKIAAIKVLRQMSADNKWSNGTMGLGDAKYAIEHFTEFIQFIRYTGRFPQTDFFKTGMK